MREKEVSSGKYPRLEFRLSKMLERNLRMRADKPEGQDKEKSGERENTIHAIGKRDLERTYTVLPLVLPRFSLPEARVLCHVIGSNRRAMNDIDQFLRNLRLLPGEVREELEESPVNDVHEYVFVARLKKLSLFETWAIYDAVERFWQGSYHVEDTEQRLEEVGLI